ncbi:enoyl-CoA hydratase-related protein [Sphingomonas montanisoli]|uniref:Enoyl-CoA hydratase n=1 Tax=Sphingomonas montanisoli TaxID=2606412 RepID=A0A5D9CCD1_9SPHN|nr:enoyl-CoA hydratase-related protein [Sphingomonas montanisoli]TZG29404.1 enoyl-CoA hydratase [Sphingomonas montanisoli]
MSDTPLLHTLDKGVLTLTLNRPDRLNAMTSQMIDGLREQLERANLDAAIRAVVITGAGRGFCAGHDLSGVDAAAWELRASDDAPDAPIRLDMLAAKLIRDAEIFALIRGMGKPVIASLRGPVVGSGLILAAACDLRIVSTTVMFRGGFVSAGRCGDPGGSYLITKIVGPAAARALYLLDEKIDAQRALTINLATQVIDDTELDAHVAALAAEMAAGPTMAYAGIKRNLITAETANYSDLIANEAITNVAASMSHDGKEAAAAFMERRAPVFLGR